jgi:5-methylcytosine-specific restriction endonuclease McrA
MRTIPKRCLDCGRLTEGGSRCPACTRRRRRVYDNPAARAQAKAAIAASPRCEQCGATSDLTADHVVPVIDGAGAGPLRVLCRRCNSARGSRPLLDARRAASLPGGGRDRLLS